MVEWDENLFEHRALRLNRCYEHAPRAGATPSVKQIDPVRLCRTFRINAQWVAR
jgi:hypothetical protein